MRLPLPSLSFPPDEWKSGSLKSECDKCAGQQSHRQDLSSGAQASRVGALAQVRCGGGLPG